MKKKVSPKVKEIITQSKKEALRLGHDYIGTEHLLLGIIRKPDSFAAKVLVSLRIDIEELEKTIDENTVGSKMTTTDLQVGELPLNRHADKAIKIMSLEAQGLKNEEVCPEHLVLAILKYPENVGAKILNNLNVDYEHYKSQINLTSHIIRGEARQDISEYDNDDKKGKRLGEESRQQRKTYVADDFIRNITKLVNEDREHLVVERDAEIQLIVQMLCKKERNNVLLIGESGVGKRAIIEEFAYQIQYNSVYARYFNQIVELDWGAIMEDAKYRGDIEERIRKTLNRLARFPKTIILLDQIHIICQYTGKGLFISDILKPILEYGQFKIIGVTSTDKYHYIATDNTINSYFRKLFIPSTSPEQTIRILEKIKSKYEDFHSVIYEKDAIEACVKLTHLQGDTLPGKAIDLIDEIAAKVRLDNVIIPDSIKALRQKIQTTIDEKNQAIKMGKYRQAADIRDIEYRLIRELELEEMRWMKESASNPITITTQDVEKAFHSIKKFRQP